MPRYLRNFKNKLYFKRRYIACFWCDLSLERNEATVEHLVSKANNGSNKFKNLVISCTVCQVERSKLTGFFVMIISKKIRNLQGWILNVKTYLPLIIKYKDKCQERIKNINILNQCLYELQTILNLIGYKSS